MNSKIKTIITVTCFVAVGLAVYISSGNKPVEKPREKEISLPPFEVKIPYTQTKMENGDIVLGDVGAPVEIVEYSDYQCPACGFYFANAELLIRKNYVASGKAKIIYKDLIVVDGFIPGSRESTDAALSARCAGDEGKFWEYHDALYAVETADGKENNGNLTRDLFIAIAEKLALDKPKFESCFDGKNHLGEVNDYSNGAQKVLSQISTPSIFLNGELVIGARPYEQFEAVINKALTNIKK